MAGLYIIGFHWNGPPKTAALERSLATVGNWLRFDQSFYILRTEKNAAAIHAAVAPLLTREDYEYIARIDETDISGWVPQWINDWVTGRPYQVPQPPTAPPAMRPPSPPPLLK
jgi:hypothetical protein